MSRSSSPDSLFSETGTSEDAPPVAGIKPPPIPGLYIFPSILAREVASHVLERIGQEDHFLGGSRDQVMFFTSGSGETTKTPNDALPAHLSHLLSVLEERTKDLIPLDSWNTIFDQPLARQCILNLYPPGTGISPHVDLANRYADGVFGVSLAGSATMTFARESREEPDKVWREEYHVHLPPRSVYILTGPARWDWSHGIAPLTEDLVDRGRGTETIFRETRVSVTYRWIKPGGEVLR